MRAAKFFSFVIPNRSEPRLRGENGEESAVSSNIAISTVIQRTSDSGH